MGRYDNAKWVETEDFTYLKELKFTENMLTNYFKSLIEIIKTEGI